MRPDVPFDGSLLHAVIDRLGLHERPLPTGDGLHRLYAAWCEAVPFDNVQKLAHLARRDPGPLPGSTAESFFTAWLDHGSGGTCWAGNGALYELLLALGFHAERALATMLAAPNAPPNHGSVVVTVEGARYITDASILSGVPLLLPSTQEGAGGACPLAWVRVRGGVTFVIWKNQRAPDGFECRFERVGVDAEEWNLRHQRTAAWGPFNYAIATRILRRGRATGVGMGQEYTITADGVFSAVPIDRDGRDAHLVQTLGITDSLVRALPDDAPTPPPPT